MVLELACAVSLSLPAFCFISYNYGRVALSLFYLDLQNSLSSFTYSICHQCGRLALDPRSLPGSYRITN